MPIVPIVSVHISKYVPYVEAVFMTKTMNDVVAHVRRASPLLLWMRRR